MNNDTFLEINQLQIDFAGNDGVVHAIQDLNLNLKKGETIGIVGESGSGKSVTSLAIMGLLPPQGKIANGTIYFNNKLNQKKQLNCITEKEFQHIRGNEISMIFQEPMTSLNPVHTCGLQVAEVIMLHEKLNATAAKKRTLALFEQVMLPRAEQLFKSYPHQLSGGQKQRVMIAMAIACKPQLLIADEPTTALDVTVQQTILDLLKDLQKEYQMGMIFITHDLGVVAQIAQKIVVMHKGKTVEHGPVQQIFNAPQHPYTKGLLACKPPLHERPERLLTVADFLNESEDIPLVKQVAQSQRSAKHHILYAATPLLQVQELTTQFITKKGFIKPSTTILNAVDHVSFDVYKGETLGLVGESGCGKSTLGRSILRLIEPISGKIIYNNRNLLELNANEMLRMRSKMQLIFQDPFSSLNPRITVGNAIAEPIEVHGMARSKEEIRDKVMKLLHRVGLTEQHYDRYPHEFSGGQRQRIGIARTLAVEPEFIVCDESVSALDVSVQAQVLNLLNELKEEFKLTYIFISHDLSVVKYMCDQIIVMQKGKIVEMAEADQLYSNPQSGYTKKLIEAIPKQMV
jgi:peptide/nickel transport system ATP-binding protein